MLGFDDELPKANDPLSLAWFSSFMFIDSQYIPAFKVCEPITLLKFSRTMNVGVRA